MLKYKRLERILKFLLQWELTQKSKQISKIHTKVGIEMKNKGSFGLIAGLIAGTVIKSASKNGIKNAFGIGNRTKNACPTCDQREYTIREMLDIFENCSYSAPGIEDIKYDIARANEPFFPSGSMNKEDVLNVLKSNIGPRSYEYTAVSVLFETLEAKGDFATLNTLSDLISRLASNFSGQLLILLSILLDMGMADITQIEKGDEIEYDTTTAKDIAKMVRVVGPTIFTLRYLQRSVLCVTPSQVENFEKIPKYKDLYTKAKDWQKKWRKDTKSSDKTQDEIVDELFDQLNSEFDLQFDKRRYIDRHNEKGARIKGKYSRGETIEKVCGMAWFYNLAKACGHGRNNPLMYTYPVEAINNRTGLNGTSVFEYVNYKLRVPNSKKVGTDIKSKFPDTYRYFESFLRNSEIDINKFVEIDNSIDEPRISMLHPKTGEKCSMVYFSTTSSFGEVKDFAMFTKTHKMGTISFSIPAGQIAAGGSCTVAGMNVARPGIGVSDMQFICNGCYALAGNYALANNVMSNAPRINWLVKVLKEGKSESSIMKIDTNGHISPYNQGQYVNFPTGMKGNVRFGDDGAGNSLIEFKYSGGMLLGFLLSISTESFARYGGGSGRSELEIGFTNNGKLSYYRKDGKVQNIDSNTLITGDDSQSFFKLDSKNRQGLVSGYFRVHDSGDFSIHSSKEIKWGYIMAWHHLCKCFPNLNSWAPTRIWTSGYGKISELKKQSYLDEKIDQLEVAGLMTSKSKQELQRLKNQRASLQYVTKKGKKAILNQDGTIKTEGREAEVITGLTNYRDWLEENPRYTGKGKDRKLSKAYEKTVLQVSKALESYTSKELIMNLTSNDFIKKYVFQSSRDAYYEFKQSRKAVQVAKEMENSDGIYPMAPMDLMILDYAASAGNFVIRPSGLTVVTPFTSSLFPIPMISNQTMVCMVRGNLTPFRPSNISAGTGVNFSMTTTEKMVGKKDQKKKFFDFTAKTYKKVGLEDLDESVSKEVKINLRERIRISLLAYTRGIYGLPDNTDSYPKKVYPPFYDQTGSKAYQCPAGQETNDAGEAIKATGTCRGSDCRYCWVRPNKSVTYGEH